MKVSELKEILKNANDMDDVYVLVHINPINSGFMAPGEGIYEAQTFNRLNVTHVNIDQFRIVLHVETIDL